MKEQETNQIQRNNFKNQIIFFIFALFLCSNIFSHPHTFISPVVDLDIKEKVLEKIKISWVFDAMTSAQVMEIFDKNKNRKLDPNEVKIIKENIFKNLNVYQYYTFIKINKKMIFFEPNNFTTYINDKKRLVYYFEINIKKNTSDLELTFRDESIYISFKMNPENVILKENDKFTLKTTENSFQMKQKN